MLPPQPKTLLLSLCLLSLGCKGGFSKLISSLTPFPMPCVIYCQGGPDVSSTAFSQWSLANGEQLLTLGLSSGCGTSDGCFVHYYTPPAQHTGGTQVRLLTGSINARLLGYREG